MYPLKFKRSIKVPHYLNMKHHQQLLFAQRRGKKDRSRQKQYIFSFDVLVNTLSNGLTFNSVRTLQMPGNKEIRRF